MALLACTAAAVLLAAAAATAAAPCDECGPAACRPHGVAKPRKGFQVACRGSGLLWDLAHVALSAATVPRSLACPAQSGCGIRLHKCGSGSAENVTVYARLEGESIVVGESIADHDGVTVHFVAPLPGTYTVTHLQLHWLGDGTEPGTDPVYLGDSEMRCPPFSRCTGKPRQQPACTNASAIPGGDGIEFHIGPPLTTPPTRRNNTSCDGTEAGFWTRLPRQHGKCAPEKLPHGWKVAGDPCLPSRPFGNLDGSAQPWWYWVAPECEFAYYSSADVRRCFLRTGVQHIIFAGGTSP